MRLLILSCSARKRGPAEPIPALDRYDGSLWRVLRSYLHEQPIVAADLHVYGFSAEFGLIPGDQRIPHYDRTMDSEQADALRPHVRETFATLMGQGYAQICLGVSDRYLRAMEGWETLVPADVDVRVTDGPMGTKLGQLRAWLEGRVWMPADRPTHVAAPVAPHGKVMLSGVLLHMTREDVFVRARAALANDDAGARRYRDWYVRVDDQRVAAKWLASVISGLPTSRFDASNARRALLALGIDVEREI